MNPNGSFNHIKSPNYSPPQNGSSSPTFKATDQPQGRPQHIADTAPETLGLGGGACGPRQCSQHLQFCCGKTTSPCHHVRKGYRCCRSFKPIMSKKTCSKKPTVKLLDGTHFWANPKMLVGEEQDSQLLDYECPLERRHLSVRFPCSLRWLNSNHFLVSKTTICYQILSTSSGVLSKS